MLACDRLRKSQPILAAALKPELRKTDQDELQARDAAGEVDRKSCFASTLQEEAKDDPSRRLMAFPNYRLGVKEAFHPLRL
jgi:hypothetical protein